MCLFARVYEAESTQDKTRTCTTVRSLVPETSVSTNSTTWASLPFRIIVVQDSLLNINMILFQNK